MVAIRKAGQEIADRQIVISFVGGPLSNGAGFARDLRPIQLAEGTYRFLEFGSDGDAVFEWGPTHYVDHSTQPDTSHRGRGAAMTQHKAPEDRAEQYVVTSLRVYLAIEESRIEEVAERLADTLIDLGCNSGEDGASAAIVCVSDSPDVAAWAEGPAEEFVDYINSVLKAPFLIVPDPEREESADAGRGRFQYVRFDEEEKRT